MKNYERTVQAFASACRVNHFVEAGDFLIGVSDDRKVRLHVLGMFDVAIQLAGLERVDANG